MSVLPVILSSQQYGFRFNRSTELLVLMDKNIININDNLSLQISILICLELSIVLVTYSYYLN